MSPKVSVITPVYNASKYLDRSIKSVLSQSLQEIELILINDGSTDNSLRICESYALNDSRVTVVSQVNKGVASARQTGLSEAKGEYIIHLDSDDYFFNNVLEGLYKRAISSKSDLVIGSYLVSNPETNNSQLYEVNIKQPNAKRLVNSIFSGEVHGSLSNKLIKRKMYNGLYFEEGLDFMEDVLILTKILLKYQPKIICAPDVIVMSYNQRPESYTNSYTKEYLDKGIEVIKSIEKVISIYSPELDLEDLTNLKVRILALYILYIDTSDFKLVNILPEVSIKNIWQANIKIHQKVLIISNRLGLSSLSKGYLLAKKFKREML